VKQQNCLCPVVEGEETPPWPPLAMAGGGKGKMVNEDRRQPLVRSGRQRRRSLGRLFLSLAIGGMRRRPPLASSSGKVKK
jgi:hypothetical protein